MNKRSIGLDTMRMVAILLVVFYHSESLLDGLFGIQYVGASVKKIFASTQLFGTFGVEIFFGLSGFLIGGILIKQFQSGKTGFKSIIHFWKRRWFRTLPAYFVVLILNFIVWRNFDFLYIIFCQNFYWPQSSFFIESWSLSVEEWSYLLFPLFLFVFNFLFKNRLTKQKIIFYGIISFIVSAWIFRIMRIVQLEGDDYFNSYIRSIVTNRLDAILYGILMAYFFRYNQSFLERNKKLYLRIGVIGLIIVYVLMKLAFAPFNYYNKYSSYRLFVDVVALPLINVLTVLTIPYLVFIKEIKSKKIAAFITWISKHSYSMYLVHYSLIFLAVKEILPQTYTPQLSLILFISYFVIVFLASYILYNLVEKPFLVLRDKFT